MLDRTFSSPSNRAGRVPVATKSPNLPCSARMKPASCVPATRTCLLVPVRVVWSRSATPAFDLPLRETVGGDGLDNDAKFLRRREKGPLSLMVESLGQVWPVRLGKIASRGRRTCGRGGPLSREDQAGGGGMGASRFQRHLPDRRHGDRSLERHGGAPASRGFAMPPFSGCTAPVKLGKLGLGHSSLFEMHPGAVGNLGKACISA